MDASEFVIQFLVRERLEWARAEARRRARIPAGSPLRLRLGAEPVDLRTQRLGARGGLVPLIADEDEREGEHHAGDRAPRAAPRLLLVHLVQVVVGRLARRRLQFLLRHGHVPLLARILPSASGAAQRNSRTRANRGRAGALRYS